MQFIRKHKVKQYLSFGFTLDGLLQKTIGGPIEKTNI